MNAQNCLQSDMQSSAPQQDWCRFASVMSSPCPEVDDHVLANNLNSPPHAYAYTPGPGLTVIHGFDQIELTTHPPLSFQINAEFLPRVASSGTSPSASAPET